HSDRFGSTIPVRVRLGPLKAYVLSSAEHFDLVLRGSRDLRSGVGVLMVMQLLFDLPSAAKNFYQSDNSGVAPNPLPGTNVPAHHRVGFMRHHAASKYLNGAHLQGMTERFVETFKMRIMSSEHISDDQWTELPDFQDWLQKELFRSAMRAMCGPHFERLSPTSADDFWEYMRFIPVYGKGLPRWTNRAAYRARDRVLGAIMRWHSHAVEHAGCEPRADDSIWDEYWGAKIMKERYAYATKTEHLSAEAKASEDLAMIFAMNANAVPATVWFVLELTRSPELLLRVRKEVSAARIKLPSGEPSPDPFNLDVHVLGSSALLQSCYAEILRLYMTAALMRSPERNDYILGRWRFPRGKLIVLSSRTAHHNTDLWNQGTPDDFHPIDKFWSDRFLGVPDDEVRVGPARVLQTDKEGPTVTKSPSDHDNTSTKTDPEIKFSMERVSAGGWVPYGGGAHICPGRFFAKNEMLATFALISTAFDIELLDPDMHIEPNMDYFPIGMLPPKPKLPFRIRRKTTA
ncbi:cytochrome P450, partial [Aureobasidium subglaciale]